MKHQIIEETKVANGYIKVFKKTFELEDKSTYFREVMVTRPAVAGLVFNEDTDEYILVKQYRPGPDADIIEVVAGVIEDGHDPKETMIREIEEEIGYKPKAENVKNFTSYYSSPGISSEQMYLFHVKVNESDKVSDGGGLKDEHEFIEIIRVPKDKIMNLIHRKDADGKTTALILWDMYNSMVNTMISHI